MKLRIVIFFTLFLIFNACTSMPKPPLHKLTCKENIYDLKAERCMDIEGLVHKLSPYPVLFIGDHHDAPQLHQEIAHFIALLANEGYRIHFASEWFAPEENALLARFVRGDINASQLQHDINWSRRVGYAYESYAPIYEAVTASGGALYGLNLSRNERKLISEDNRTAMSMGQLAFYEGLDLNVSAHKMQMAPFLKHCHSAKKGEERDACAKRMYRVQVAWDSKMACEAANLEYKLLKTPRDKLIVFAGAYHLQNHLGINMRFSRLSDALHVTLLPEPDKNASIPLGYSDYLLYYNSASTL